MMNKRGASKWDSTLTLILIIGGILTFYALFNTFFGYSFADYLNVPDYKLSLAETTFVSYTTIFESEKVIFLDYIFGKIPNYLYEATGGIESKGVSSAIIMIGIWIMFFLIFSDIAQLFGTFGKGVHWIMGIVLTVLVANLKIVAYFAVLGMSFASIFGAFSIIVSIIGMFIVFILFSFGSKAIRDWIVERKKDELKMRAEIGRARIGEGVRTAADLGKATAKAGE